jgi:glycopeptide antibiotics resistance protein
MFIPIGIIWPIVYKELDTPVKTIAAGAGLSLFIEILQLPFYDRVSDIDDLLLNTLGFAVGYGVYRLVARINGKKEMLK